MRSVSSKYVTVLTALVLAGAVAQAAGAAAAAPGRHSHIPAVCAKSFNPYREPASLVRACGDRILPLRHVTALPGGGKAYSYGDYTQLVPPAHFNVLRASDKRLSEYGFPTRKQLGSRFYAVMRHYRHEVAPPKFMVMSNTKAASDTGNWSGYNVNSHTYTDVSASWTEPGFTSAGGCTGDEFAQWAGLGGLKSDFIGQAGTAWNYAGIGQHQAWIEAVNGPNDDVGPAAVPLTATKGATFDVVVTWDPLNSWYDYSMTNEATQLFYNGHSRVVSSDTVTAEVITERPDPDGQLTELSDYTGLNVLQSEASYGTTRDVGFFTLSHNAITMDDGINTPGRGTTVSFPSTLHSDNTFTMTWNKCSVPQIP